MKKVSVSLFTGVLLFVILNHEEQSHTYLPDQIYQKPKTRLVTLTSDGGISYGHYANEGETDAIHTLPDFSFAGYMGGGVALPNLPVKVTLKPQEGDCRPLIQNAIDKVSSMPADSNGFRGKVLLKAGTYAVAGTLEIKAGGVVLAGEGQDEGGTILKAVKEAQHTFIIIGDDRSSYNKEEETAIRITSEYVPTGATSFKVQDASDYQVGDTILVQRTPNMTWIIMLDMHQYGWTTKKYAVPHERVITDIDHNNISVNIPVVDPVKLKEGGGQILKAKIDRKTKKSGVENLRLVSSYEHATDELHGWDAVKLRMAENCWVKKVTAQYFGRSCVTIEKKSVFNTIEDCAMLDPKSHTKGQRKYSFSIESGSFNLFQRCFTRGGRHDYVTGARVAGPNVFLDSYATQTHSDIGPHHRWATGTLFDNIKGGEMRVRNRKGSGTGHGWAGAQTMFWNCTSTSEKGITVESPPGSINWIVGGKADQLSGNGHREAFGEEVQPRSLYLAQLESRLGKGAVVATTTAQQRGKPATVQHALDK